MADPGELYQAIGQALVEELPDGWRSVEVSCYMITVFTEFHGWYTTESGEKVSFEVPDDLFDYFAELRDLLYEPGKGAWLSATFRMDNTGKFSVDYDYENRPPFHPQPENESWLLDLERYPRDPEFLPTWMPRPTS
jgi:hypothetical protein